MKRRLFVGIDLPKETKKLLACIPTKLAGKLSEVRWEDKEKYHLTLAFLGSTQVSSEKILITLDNKLKSFHSFIIEFDEVGIFFGKTTAIILNIKKNEPLLQLFYKVQNCLEPLGFPREKRSFHPHITLGRCKSQTTKLPNLKIVQQVLVTEVTLFESILLSHGSVYKNTGSVKLVPHLW